MLEYGTFDYSTVVQSRADGTFEVPYLEAGEGVLKHWGPNDFREDVQEPFLHGKVPVVVRAGMDPLCVVLDAGVLVQGRVLGPDGRPAKGVPIRGLLIGGSEEDLEECGESGNDGTFGKRLRPGTYEIRFYSEDFKRVLSRKEVQVLRGGVPSLEVKLDP